MPKNSAPTLQTEYAPFFARKLSDNSSCSSVPLADSSDRIRALMDVIQMVSHDGQSDRNGVVDGQYNNLRSSVVFGIEINGATSDSYLGAVKVHTANCLQKSVAPAETIQLEIDGHFGRPSNGCVTDDSAIGSIHVTSVKLEWKWIRL